MKKYLLSLIFIISSFIVFDSVKAATIPTDYGNVQFDFSTFKQTHSELSDYNYYFITKRNNEQEPVLFFFKDIPHTQKLDYSLTFSSSYNIYYYNYNFNTNTWSLGSSNENLKFSFKNVFYDYNISSIPIENINYSVDILPSTEYSSLTLKYSPINVTYSFSTNGDYKFYYDTDTKQFINVSYNNSSINYLYNQTKDNFIAYVATPNVVVIEKDSSERFYLISSDSTFESFSSSSSSVVGFTGFTFNTGSGVTLQTNYSPNLYKNQNSSNSLTKLVENDLFFANSNIYSSDDTIRFESNFSPVVINKVTDFGNNSYGFYQNYVSVDLTTLSGTADTLSILCENNKPFINNYCSINYDDLLDHNSSISSYDNYGASFTQMFGSNSGYLLNDRYYLYSFRIQKPFVPQVGNLFINSLTDNSNQVNILGVYLQDGGSYTDYVIKFKITGSNYSSLTSLNDIMVVFRDGLSAYYSTIPNSFNYSVYRSFKLQYFSSEPTMNDVNDFYNYHNLSTIDGINSNYSFFTDNEFNTFGFGGIITAPFRFLSAIENYQTCSDINIPFPHSNQNLTLKCVRSNIPSSLNPLISILQIILSGFVCYRIAVETLSVIKDISSPEDANIEVVDL